MCSLQKYPSHVVPAGVLFALPERMGVARRSRIAPTSLLLRYFEKIMAESLISASGHVTETTKVLHAGFSLFSSRCAQCLWCSCPLQMHVVC